MNNIYFNEQEYLVFLLLMCIIWCILSYTFYNKIKKVWLYLLFPTALLNIPIVYYTLYASEKTPYIFSMLAIFGYYVYRLFSNRINRIDIILIPILLFIFNMYVALTRPEGACLIAP